ncbi:UNVERIFIED_CONTAM: hypothetical protein Sangu_2160900 [Sesamum angustifolium]|uniref:Uncharacterized protein n=1 Tax=Sesamum angustifolium TaxID=2727405 RepID=A0AAW2LH02_9LAMI
MQFLIGLNDSFDKVCNQILMMEPLPSVTKEYSMVLHVEKQREVSSVFSSTLQNSGMQTRGTMQGTNTRNNWKRKATADKRNQICAHYGKTWHLRENCIETCGYPDWYKALVDQRKKG